MTRLKVAFYHSKTPPELKRRIPPLFRPKTGQALLRLLQTTDMHGQVLPYDYCLEEPRQGGGLARIATLVRAARAGVAQTLLLDTGDFLQGTPMADVAYRGLKCAHLTRNPIIAAMNALEYDAVTLGNHEFNYGLDYLRAALDEARFPCLGANLQITDGGAQIAKPWVVIDRTLQVEEEPLPIRIGVLGLTPPQITQWDALHLDGRLTAADMIATARAELPALRAAGADLVVGLCHTGLGSGDPEEMSEHAALHLAGLEGLDVLLFGHSHARFPGPAQPATEGIDQTRSTLHGKPAVNAGAEGENLGLIDLALQHDGTRWRIADHAVTLLPVARQSYARGPEPLVRPDPAIGRIMAKAHDLALTYIRKPIGHSSRPIHSYFAMTGNDASLQIVADAQRTEVQRALRGSEWADLPILSAVSPFKAGGPAGPDHFVDIPAGPLAMRHAADLYGFPNSVCALLITGKDLRNWLDRAAIAFSRLVPGRQAQPLLDETVPGYHFDVIDGLTYRIDLSRPPRVAASGHLDTSLPSRIRDLRHGGEPVADAQHFVLATSSYRAGGGGQYHEATRLPLLLPGVVSTRDAILRHLREAGTIAPVPRPTWAFSPLDGATALFATGQGAARHMADLRRYPIRGVTADASGFLLCEIDLSPQPGLATSPP